MFRFTIRDLLWLMVVVALALTLLHEQREVRLALKSKGFRKGDILLSLKPE